MPQPHSLFMNDGSGVRWRYQHSILHHQNHQKIRRGRPLLNVWTIFLKGRNTYIICTRARGADCQWDCDNKSKDRIYNSGTCSSYSRTCEAQPKDSARKRHSARQHQSGQATRCKRIASTYKFMRSQVGSQKFISSTSQKNIQKIMQTFCHIKNSPYFCTVFQKKREPRLKAMLKRKPSNWL